MKYKQILLTRPPTGSNALQGGSDADPHPQPPLGLAYLAGVLERLPDVNVLDIASLPHQFGVVSADFLETGFDPTDVCDLASQVKMNQTDTILDVLLLGNFQGFHQFDRAQAEFGVFAAGRSPAARSGADQLNTEADVRPNIEFF